MVPEPEDVEAATLQHCCSRGIVFDVLCMLPAIEFDDEPGLKAREVGEISVDRDLTSELEAIQFAAPERQPKASLGLRPVTA